MKKILRFTLLTSFTVAAQNQLWGNLEFSQGAITIIKIAFILAIFEIFLKPVIKILLLPINILTLGLFRIIINTFGFYLATFLLSDFKVNTINIAASNWQNYSVPAVYIPGFWAYLVNASTNNFLLYIFKSILKTKKEKK